MSLHRRIGRPATSFIATLVGTLMGLPSLVSAQQDVVSPAPPAPTPYRFEFDPHLVLGTAPPGSGQGSGVGAGLRASVVILPDGLIRAVEDSIAISVGLDYGRYFGKWALNDYQDRCVRHELGPNETQVCTQVTTGGGTYTYLYVPVVIQWNLSLSHRLSAFAEPGVNLYYLDGAGLSAVPALYVGGRLRLSDRIALIGRIGYPTLALGLSFRL